MSNMTEQQQFKVGDEVIATSKTDPQTVIHGKVGDGYPASISILPEGHRLSNIAYFKDFDIVKVEPPIVFGPEAVIRWKDDGATWLRNSQGVWRDADGELMGRGDRRVGDAYKNGELDVLDWGLGVER